MINVIPSASRGSADHGWLQARHTFSFADYYDAARMGFGPLRVINEDRIAPGQGFGTHPHQDMEIVTYIVSGALQHKDSMGNGSVIAAGDVQRMTAGTGVFHSEFNHSAEREVHLLQIWMLPEQRSLAPGYEQQHFGRADKLNRWRLLGSRDGRGGSLTIHQDISLYASVLEPGRSLAYEFGAERSGFLQVIAGSLATDNVLLRTGDGAEISGVRSLSLTADAETELIFFDMN
jgi:redox-sensitive bicupin YhaK (pirin superfamily)